MDHPSASPGSHSRLRVKLWLRLLKLSGSIEAEIRRRLREQHDTTLPRFDVMAALSRHPDGLKMSELSGLLRVSNGNVTGILDRLTLEGLAERVAVPEDRRAQMARLTVRGREVFDGLAKEHEHWVDELLGALTPDEAEELMALVQRALKSEIIP